MKREVTNRNRKQVGVSQTFQNRHLKEVGNRIAKEIYNCHSREFKHLLETWKLGNLEACTVSFREIW